MTGGQRRAAGAGVGERTAPGPLALLPTHRIGAATTTLTVSLVLAGAGLSFAGGGFTAAGGSANAVNVQLAWWQLGVMFAAAAVFVAHIEVGSVSHTFSLSEIPLVLGLLFAAPADLIGGRLVAEALVLAIHARQPPAKLAFNLGMFFAETSLAVAVQSAIGPGDGQLGVAACSATFAAAATAGQLGAVAVWAVIRVHGGHARALPLMTAAVLATTANASLAVVAAVLYAYTAWALVPLVVVCAVVVAAYRGYSTLSRRYGGLRALYEFTTTTSAATRYEQAVTRVLGEVRRVMRAETAMAFILAPSTATATARTTTATTAAELSAAELSTAELSTAAGPAMAPSEGTSAAAGALPCPERTTGEWAASPPGGRSASGLPEWVRDHVLADQTLLIPRGTSDRALLAVLAHLGAADLVAAPMTSGGLVTGVLVAADRLGQVNTFDTNDVLMLATIASQAAIAIDSARLVERLHDQIRAREHDALHDALTGLPNRSAFLRSLEHLLTAGGDHRAAVLLMDLNGFKDVNDTLGHRVGDHLLEQVALRLRQTLPAATVARLGGDEFAVVVPAVGPSTSPPSACLTVAEHLSGMLREPFILDQLTLEITASIGVAVAPDHGTDAATLLQRADVAMYSAKQAQTPAALYDPDADWHTHDRLRLAHELRRAIEAGQITVAYQPIARTGDEHVGAVEALARWHHPDLGAIDPDTFIPVAERTGLIHDLTWNILNQALSQARAWFAAGLDLTVNVNVSVQLLRDRALPDKISSLLEHHHLPPSALALEITETGIMTDPRTMIRTLNGLVTTGVSLAVDDFGTGHSSLAYLQRLPVNKVKIDKSFVLSMATDSNARAIVRSVIELAHSLNLQTVAEGVEDQRAVDRLTALGCDHLQGYYLSRPLCAAEITEWLTERARPTVTSTPRLRAVRTGNA